MSGNERCFTFIWKIKKFNFYFSRSEILSPSFFVHVIRGTKWRFSLCPNSLKFEGCVACYIQAEYSDSASDELELDYEFSFLARDGSVLHSEIFHKKLCRNGYIDGIPLHVKKEEVFFLNKDMVTLNDSLTIRFRMWDSRNPITLSGRCFAETLIETECRSFVGTIKKFSCLETRGKYPICINSSSTEAFFSSMNLCAAADDKLVIETELVNQKFISLYRYKIFIQDIFGNKVKYGEAEFRDSKSHCISLTLSKEHLTENKRYYFPKDVLTIECEVTFPTGKTIGKINGLEYGFDYQDTQEIIPNKANTNFSSKEQHTESLTTLKDDLNSLFKEEILCDTKLKTANTAFPAHTLVLSARSSVFKSMFTTDMKEKTNKCVDIDDLDDDTVRRMLLFMYSDRLENLEYESARSLYFAADKYNIVSLLQRCSNFLKQNLLQSNCCDILLLADKHEDKDLKDAVQDYIAKNDEAVLLSDEWQILEKNHPQLTIEVLRAVCMKNRRS